MHTSFCLGTATQPIHVVGDPDQIEVQSTGLQGWVYSCAVASCLVHNVKEEMQSSRQRFGRILAMYLS